LSVLARRRRCHGKGGRQQVKLVSNQTISNMSESVSLTSDGLLTKRIVRAASAPDAAQPPPRCRVKCHYEAKLANGTREREREREERREKRETVDGGR
jgi:FKBP-type peptidyl-prolyl cis-trans isomerase